MKVSLSPETDGDVPSQVARQPKSNASLPPEQNEVPNFEALYREHFAFVWRSLRAIGVNTACLDDAVQDVFVVVHRQLPGFEQRASVRSWVFAIAYNVASNYRRREHRKGGLIPLDPETPTNQLDPENQLRRAQAWEFLSGFLDSLDDAKRAVFVLTQLEGLKATEVATALNIPVNTVYTRLHAARQAFHEALAASHPGGRQ